MPMRPVMRRLALSLAVLCCALPASAAAMTKSQAVDLANAVNLSSSDVPNFTASPPDYNTGKGDAAFVKCARTVPEKKAVADIPSADYEQNTPTQYAGISSDVEVLPSVALANKDVRASKSKRAQKCLAASLKKQKIPGARIAAVKVTVLKRPGATYGWRIRETLAGGGQRATFISDALLVAEGQVEVGLLYVTSPGTPAASDEARLVNILKTRLDAALQPNTII